MHKPHVPYKLECVHGVVNEKKMNKTELKHYYHTRTAAGENDKKIIASTAAVDDIQ